MSAPATDSAGPTLKGKWSLREGLKKLWWMRGVLGAFALVDILDRAGLPWHEWLQVFPAIGARWHDLMNVLSNFLNAHLPWDWAISPGEATIISLIWFFVVPIGGAAIWYCVRAAALTPLIEATAFGISILSMMIAMLGPIDLSTEPVALTCLAYLTTVELTRIGIAIRIYQFEGHDGWKLQFRPSVVFFTVVMLWLVYDLISLPSDGTLSYATLMVISFLALTGFVIPIVAIYSAFFVATMWFASSTYFKAALVTLTFLLTLELLCLVPLVRDWVELFVDWIDPRGTTAPLPMLPGL